MKPRSAPSDSVNPAIPRQPTALAFLATIKAARPPVFRSKVVRDLACILDVNPAVLSWQTGAEPFQLGRAGYVADIVVFDDCGNRWLLDAPDRGKSAKTVESAAASAGHKYRVVSHEEIYDGFRLRNARDLLRYGNYTVSLSDRVKLLSMLDAEGALTLANCLEVLRHAQSVAIVASMILHGFIEVDLDDALIGPETMVRRIRR